MNYRFIASKARDNNEALKIEKWMTKLNIEYILHIRLENFIRIYAIASIDLFAKLYV